MTHNPSLHTPMACCTFSRCMISLRQLSRSNEILTARSNIFHALNAKGGTRGVYVWWRCWAPAVVHQCMCLRRYTLACHDTTLIRPSSTNVHWPNWQRRLQKLCSLSAINDRCLRLHTTTQTHRIYHHRIAHSSSPMLIRCCIAHVMPTNAIDLRWN